jgi:hypothetical protein
VEGVDGVVKCEMAGEVSSPLSSTLLGGLFRRDRFRTPGMVFWLCRYYVLTKGRSRVALVIGERLSLLITRIYLAGSKYILRRKRTSLHANNFSTKFSSLRPLHQQPIITGCSSWPARLIVHQKDHTRRAICLFEQFYVTREPNTLRVPNL